MKTIETLLNEIVNEENREKIVRTIEETAKAICCENVEWKDFLVNSESEKLLKKMISNYQLQFLIPVFEFAKNSDNNRKIFIIIIPNSKEDEFWPVKVSAKEIHGVIYLSKTTTKYLNNFNETE